MKLAPSILASDLANLAGAAGICEAGGSDVVHFDVMDGHFVPNLTFGIPVLANLRKHTEMPIDVHLMVREPERLLHRYLAAGANWISVHWEATTHLDRALRQIRDGGARAGVALNPTTPVELLTDALGQLDFVVLMSVNPGFDSQPFLPYVREKVRKLRRMIDERGLEVEIEIDGGIGVDNIRDVVADGVDVCVAGSAIFKTDDPIAAQRELRRLARSGGPEGDRS
jgi:ribulose-phosphate 3-epimerase